MIISEHPTLIHLLSFFVIGLPIFFLALIKSLKPAITFLQEKKSTSEDIISFTIFVTLFSILLYFGAFFVSYFTIYSLFFLFFIAGLMYFFSNQYKHVSDLAIYFYHFLPWFFLFYSLICVYHYVAWK